MARLVRRGEARWMWLGDPDRPTLINVVFWVVLLATVGDHMLRPAETLYSVLFAINIVVVVGLWLVLPWRPATRHRFIPLLFLPATIALGMTGSYGTHLLLTLIGTAGIAFVYGMRLALAALAGMLAFIVAGTLLFNRTMQEALLQAGVVGVFAIFVLGMTSAILEARLRRAEAQALLERVRELAVAEERARMGAEMHDSIGHHLTVIKVGLENAERYRERRPDAAWQEVRQAKEVTAEALADARRWVRALRPLALDGRVGSAALEQLAASFDGTGLSVTFEVEGPERPLDPDVELVLYRVLQEGLTNALRHAEAREVHGRLTFGEDRVTLVINDDGKGGERDGAGGFGLPSLAERTRALRGVLTAGNAEGGGFELRAELPDRPPAATQEGPPRKPGVRPGVEVR
ncbi:sensor histidine kinase [Spongiactinospora rosea]|uniref:histidine kinase n=1 Tax=Spongiactinospora rosea TaxID=2248750 RepID=A0A366M1A0_9ACTN|nr:sensor histidine kinase [Spongiactinospora rosea]RBQ19570.1 sensor histidine kinase [Spongiactinospora rosea]